MAMGYDDDDNGDGDGATGDEVDDDGDNDYGNGDKDNDGYGATGEGAIGYNDDARMRVQFWPRIQGPPTRTSVLVWCRAVILSAPLYHRPSLITGQTIIPPTWPLAQLWPMECTLL